MKKRLSADLLFLWVACAVRFSGFGSTLDLLVDSIGDVYFDVRRRGFNLAELRLIGARRRSLFYVVALRGCVSVDETSAERNFLNVLIESKLASIRARWSSGSNFIRILMRLHLPSRLIRAVRLGDPSPFVDFVESSVLGLFKIITAVSEVYGLRHRRPVEVGKERFCLPFGEDVDFITRLLLEEYGPRYRLVLREYEKLYYEPGCKQYGFGVVCVKSGGLCVYV